MRWSEGCLLKRAMSPSMRWRSTTSPTFSSAASLRRSPNLRNHLPPSSMLMWLAPGQQATPAIEPGLSCDWRHPSSTSDRGNSRRRPAASFEHVGLDATWPTHAMMQEPAVAIVGMPKTTASIAAAGLTEHSAALSVLLCRCTSCSSGNKEDSSQTRLEHCGLNENLECGLHDAASSND